MTGEYARPHFPEKYSLAIRYVTNHFADRSETDRQKFLNALIQSCEQALSYSWSEEEQRKTDREAFAKGQTIANQARKISAFCRKYPSILIVPLGKACLDSGVALRVEEDGDEVGQASFLGPGLAYRMAKLLDAVAMQTEKLRQNTIPFEHRKRVGPLLFDRILDQNADVPSKETCLGLLLMYFVKRFSEGGGAHLRPGEIMPKSGDPHWPLVEGLVDVAYGSHRNLKKSVATQVRKSPNMMLLGYLGNSASEK